MPTVDTLTIANSTGGFVYAVVTNQNIGCADQPQAGQIIGQLGQGGPDTRVTYARTGGHGCDGNQGYFEIAFVSPVGTLVLDFNFDADAVMGNINQSWQAAPGAAYALQASQPSVNNNNHIELLVKR